MTQTTRARLLNRLKFLTVGSRIETQIRAGLVRRVKVYTQGAKERDYLIDTNDYIVAESVLGGSLPAGNNDKGTRL